MNKMSKSQIQQIKNDIKEECYSLKKVTEGERNPSKKKRIKSLEKKMQKSKGESIKERMLLLLKLKKELKEKYSYNRESK